MKQFLVSFFAVAVVILLAGCKKDQQQFDENLFTGTWVKGSNVSDTFWFSKKNNLNILSYNASFNDSLPVVAEMEYNYKNGKLEVKRSFTNDKTFYPIPSFTWKEQGKEFEITAIELFSFISSTDSKFVYKKVN